ncbi:XRE family transcriptional regulator [Rhizobium ruizarguesonis]|uniref:helix-turn-helix transcriptional regulator n=1 Tax=Rhizobium ruizarguesonis TaxID=2081791 RepID=UPI00102F49F0|nr:helix-turn-helix transcriptional regulator [Rhizobium ruizarguesonis]TBB53782.1 XRE family transcriptional regulator [Rhizobium ruizarguesonis]
MGRDDVDIRDASAAKARIAAGEETWPEEVVAALVAGENPVTVFRKYRGMKQVELADEVGQSQPYISEIESGQKIGSTDVMKAIALALDVDLNDIV